jgi:trehalose 6-phosphate synthase
MEITAIKEIKETILRARNDAQEFFQKAEFAGAAAKLQKGALLVNPHDTEGVADAIYRAFKMSQDERREHMRKLRGSIRKQDIYWWVNSFLQAAIERRLDNFPVLDDCLPQIELS